MSKKYLLFVRHASKACQQGMTMIEVLVSILIIGVGLAMSLSMLQTSNRFGESAEFSNSALQQAQAIIDKMKANSLAADVYVFTGGATIVNDGTYKRMYDDVSKINISDIPSLLSQACQSTGCSNAAEQTAINDVLEWNQMLQEIVPGGRGMVNRLQNIPGRNFEVIVMWNHAAEADFNNSQDVDGIRVNFSL